eukprot:SAG31_NODE_12192_length_960_cov_1.056911_2_plen_93_part_01
MNAGARDITSGGVGLVYLAGVLPSFAIKLSGPYWFHRMSYESRACVAALLAVLSFVLVAATRMLPLQLLGVACASAQSGLGEASMLALAAFHD